MSKEQPFNLQLNEASLTLTRQNTDVYLFRPEKYQDMDYFRVFDLTTEQVTNVYRLPELARLMAGLSFKANGFPMASAFPDGDTFKDKYGWYSDCYVLDKPNEQMIEGYAMVEAAHDINPDGSWEM